MTASASTSISTRRRTLVRALAATPFAAVSAFASTHDARAAEGVSVVLGDQAGGTRAVVEAAKVLDGTPYTWRWADFQGAAPLFEAQRAGSVDLAPAGDLPVLAAALGDPSLKIVATRMGSGAQLGILVAPHSAISSVSDLKGKTVFVSSARGSIFSETHLVNA